MRSLICPRHIKHVVLCFLEQFPQNVCPHGTIAFEIGSIKQIEHCGSFPCAMLFGIHTSWRHMFHFLYSSTNCLYISSKCDETYTWVAYFENAPMRSGRASFSASPVTNGIRFCNLSNTSIF